MSKLYFKGESDKRKNITMMGNRVIFGEVLYNWTGGNEPEDTALEYRVNHKDGKVTVTIDVLGEHIVKEIEESKNKDVEAMRKNIELTGEWLSGIIKEALWEARAIDGVRKAKKVLAHEPTWVDVHCPYCGELNEHVRWCVEMPCEECGEIFETSEQWGKEQDEEEQALSDLIERQTDDMIEERLEREQREEE